MTVSVSKIVTRSSLSSSSVQFDTQRNNQNLVTWWYLQARDEEGEGRQVTRFEQQFPVDREWVIFSDDKNSDLVPLFRWIYPYRRKAVCEELEESLGLTRRHASLPGLNSDLAPRDDKIAEHRKVLGLVTALKTTLLS